jgi:hypothetical protein
VFWGEKGGAPAGSRFGPLNLRRAVVFKSRMEWRLLFESAGQLEVLLRIGNLIEMRRLHIQLDNQRAAFEDAVRARTAELREAQSALEKTISFS